MLVGDLRTEVARAADFGKVVVLYGGFSSERDVSLDTGGAVLKALRKAGVDATGWDPADQPIVELAGADFDRVWIALHGPGGEDGALQGALQWLGLPYTGSGVLASSLAMDKIRSKHLFRQLGIATPDYHVFEDPGGALQAATEFGYPLVLKPAGQGSSVGMSKVFNDTELQGAAALALQFGEPALAERCITGAEMTVGILQGEALPSIRIETPRVFYDYQAKYESDDTRYHCPGTADKRQEQRYRELAVAAFAALGCRGWGRVDFMENEHGEPLVLEVNTVPGMTSHSLVPMAAARHGIDFTGLCWRILETSMSSGHGTTTVGLAANDA